jgi:hypothetical protein
MSSKIEASMKTCIEPRSKTFQISLITGFVCAIAGVVVLGQGTSGTIDLNTGFQGLIAEIRGLRIAIEESNRTQTQTQALGVYLGVQQGRIMQVATRLEADRKELEGAEARSRQLTAEKAGLETALSRETDLERRRGFEMQYRDTNQELEAATVRERQARAREFQESQALQVEDARWNELISRLEQIIKK